MTGTVNVKAWGSFTESSLGFGNPQFMIGEEDTEQ